MEHGGSIASAQRVETAGIFSAILAVWVPPGSGCADALRDRLIFKKANDTRLQGYQLSVHKTLEESKVVAPNSVPWRLNVKGPQQPGMMNGLTRVLLGDDCVVSQFEAKTVPHKKEKTVTFSANSLVMVPESAEGESVRKKLEAWATGYDAHVSFERRQPEA